MKWKEFKKQVEAKGIKDDDEIRWIDTAGDSKIEVERENLDAKAAVILKIAPVTVRTRASRMRSKYEGVLDFCKDYRSWQQTFFQRTGGAFNPLSRSGRIKSR